MKVAIAVRTGLNAFAPACQDEGTLALAESGRWHERFIPVRSGSAYVVVASLCGYSGASASPVLERKNDQLIGAAIHRATQLITTPYYLCLDADNDPEKTQPICKAVSAKVIHDLAAEWAKSDDDPAPAFRRLGVFEGMEGTGVTRIDTILANDVGAAAVTSVDYV